MIDKVQKIKDWISKEQDGLLDAQGNFEYPEHEGAYHILCNLESYIDSLQEEPVSEDLLKASVEFAKGFGDWHYAMPCFQAGAKWQEKKDQSTIELAEDHAMLAGMEKGYHQAEKDNELTWEDINTIHKLINQVSYEYPHGISEKSFGEEVLKRFKAAK